MRESFYIAARPDGTFLYLGDPTPHTMGRKTFESTSDPNRALKGETLEILAARIGYQHLRAYTPILCQRQLVQISQHEWPAKLPELQR